MSEFLHSYVRSSAGISDSVRIFCRMMSKNVLTHPFITGIFLLRTVRLPGILKYNVNASKITCTDVINSVIT